MGLGGALYAHSVGVVTPDTFYLGLTFITLSMLVVGGMNSLSGAVLGVVVLSTIIQILRWLEKGVDVGGTTLHHPQWHPGNRHRHRHDRHSDVPAIGPHQQPGAGLEWLAVRTSFPGAREALSPRPGLEVVHKL